jgi:hypothetical protein
VFKFRIVLFLNCTIINTGNQKAETNILSPSDKNTLSGALKNKINAIPKYIMDKIIQTI